MTLKHIPALMALVAVISLPIFQADAEIVLKNIGPRVGGTSSATAINDQGEIIGDGRLGMDGPTQVFQYKNGRLKNLNVRGSGDYRVSAINDAGLIVGGSVTQTTNVSIISPFPTILPPSIPLPPTNFFLPLPTNIVLHPLPPLTVISSEIAANVSGPITNSGLTTNEFTLTNTFLASQPCVFEGGVPKILGSATNAGYANGINDFDQIVGGYNFPVAGGPDSGVTHAFVYQNGLLTDLGSLGGDFAPSGATAINNRSEIVGFSMTSDGLTQHAFLYSHGLMTDLGTLGGNTSEATAINDIGEIVGNSSMATNESLIHPFIYFRGQMEDLGTLGGTQPVGFGPSNFNTATAINNWGQVVGQSTAINGAPHAFFYSDGRMVDLNDLVKLTTTNRPPGFLNLQIATGINDRGEIVGGGSYWDGRQVFYEAFLLKGAPEAIAKASRDNPLEP